MQARGKRVDVRPCLSACLIGDLATGELPALRALIYDAHPLVIRILRAELLVVNPRDAKPSCNLRCHGRSLPDL